MDLVGRMIDRPMTDILPSYFPVLVFFMMVCAVCPFDLLYAVNCCTTFHFVQNCDLVFAVLLSDFGPVLLDRFRLGGTWNRLIPSGRENLLEFP